MIKGYIFRKNDKTPIEPNDFPETDLMGANLILKQAQAMTKNEPNPITGWLIIEEKAIYYDEPIEC